MTTLDQAQQKAQQYGLEVTKGARWGQVQISDGQGNLLDTCGLDAVPAWLSGWLAARRALAPK